MPPGRPGTPAAPTATTSPRGASTAPSDRPVLLGGSPAVTLPQDEALRWPVITNEDEEAVLRVEDDFRRWLGVEHAVAHNNGTGAIHAALHAFDLQPGDEVIVPSATWWASVMPILHHGAVPVFAETEPDCLGLDPEDVERRLTDRTRAIVVVHLFGMPSKMDELLDVARRHDLRVLEDASHAHGAMYRGRPIGTLGDAAVFSMQGNKLVPSAEGGMLLTSDAAIHEKVIRYAHYERLLGMTGSPNRRFAATGFGLKCRMSPLSAAVARVQLRHLDDRNRRRNENCVFLSERLAALGLRTFLAPADCERVYFEFLIQNDEAATGLPTPALAAALRADGALVSAPRYPLLHQQPVFTDGTWAKIARLADDHGPPRTYDPTDLPRTTAGNAALIKMPNFPQAERPLLDQYVAAFEKVLAHAQDLPREQE